MNDSTRETLEHLAVTTLRRMDRTLLQMRRAQDEINRLRRVQREEIKKVEEYLDTIAKADPTFNKEAWLNHAKRELI